MSTLHTLHLASTDALTRALTAAQHGDAILLREDAVRLARDEAIIGSAFAARYALQADVIARGLDALLPAAVQVITDADFVALTLQHDRVIGWR